MPETYETHPPRASLQGVVRCLWRHRATGEGRRVERIPPDGCAEIIVNLGAPYKEETPAGALVLQPAALFAGQLTRPLTLVAEGDVETIGIRFEPDGARDFFGAPMRLATDRRIGLDRLSGVDAPVIIARLSAAGKEDCFALLEDMVEARIAGAPRDAAVVEAIRRLTNDGNVAAPEISSRQLQRRFKDRVGVSMREFSSILRFRRVFDRIEAEPDWARVALAAGYFDQAQMARDFRRYLGCTAREWARVRVGLAAAIANEMSQSYKNEALAGAK
jgi:AraC-like DNA-binding protein